MNLVFAMSMISSLPFITILFFFLRTSDKSQQWFEKGVPTCFASPRGSIRRYWIVFQDYGVTHCNGQYNKIEYKGYINCQFGVVLFVCSKSFPAKIFVGGGRLLTQALFSTKSAPASCLRVGTWPHCVCNMCNWTEMYALLYQVSSSCCFVHVSGCCSCNLNILCVYRPKFNSTWKVCTCLICTCLVCTCFVMYLLVSSQLQLLFCLRGIGF